MSQPKRYNFSARIVHIPGGDKEAALHFHHEVNGLFVHYSDYELLRQEFSLLAEERYTTIRALELEVERLTKERDHYQWASTNDGIACNERARENQDLENQIDALKAENERMRKAGDELARVASYILDTKVKAIEAWHAAKEVQS